MYPLVNVYSLLLKMAIEIVDLPMKNGVFPSFFVYSPEGKSSKPGMTPPDEAEEVQRLAQLGDGADRRRRLRQARMSQWKRVNHGKAKYGSCKVGSTQHQDSKFGGFRLCSSHF